MIIFETLWNTKNKVHCVISVRGQKILYSEIYKMYFADTMRKSAIFLELPLKFARHKSIARAREGFTIS